MSDDRRNPFKNFRIEIDPRDVEDALRRVRERLEDARERVEDGVQRAQYTRVRISYKGRRLGPDLPLSVFLAGEGVALMAIGPLYALLANFGANAVLDVEFLHEADELVEQGQEHYRHAETEEAETCYREALRKRPGDPTAHYHLGVLQRVSGRHDEALESFRAAAMGPEGHPDVVRAAQMLERLAGKRTL